MTSNTNFENLFKQAVEHRDQHDCSAYPYEDYSKLVELVLKYKPSKILEIGTGMGFTSVVMALSAPQSNIETIEKDQSHYKTSLEFIKANNVSDRISVINDIAELVLPELSASYDLIFFDGYQIHYEFLPHYQRLLRIGGILVLGNNQLTSKTSDRFFEELNNSGEWKVLDKFADTTVCIKL